MFAANIGYNQYMSNCKCKRFTAFVKRHDIPDDFDWKVCYRFWKERHKIENRDRKIVTEEQSFKIRAYTANLRAKKRGVGGIILPSDLYKIMTDAGRKCRRCGSTKHLVFDHKIPIYRGGSNTPDNIQVLCRMCNMEKGVNE